MNPGKTTKSFEIPQAKDIIKIESRWAQVINSCHPPTRESVQYLRYLDNNSLGRLDHRECELKQLYKLSLGSAMERHGIRLTPSEMSNVHWGPEEAETPRLKLLVMVFGEYEEKKLHSMMRA
jgi:hypothetical protein